MFLNIRIIMNFFCNLIVETKIKIEFILLQQIILNKTLKNVKLFNSYFANGKGKGNEKIQWI